MIYVIDQFNPFRSWCCDLDEYVDHGPSILPDWIDPCEVELVLSQLDGETVRHEAQGVVYIATDPRGTLAPAWLTEEVAA